MLFKPASMPNFPIQATIIDTQRQVNALYNELHAVGCKVVQNCGEMLIEVPAGVDVDPIMKRHREMFVTYGERHNEEL